MSPHTFSRFSVLALPVALLGCRDSPAPLSAGEPDTITVRPLTSGAEGGGRVVHFRADR